MSKQYAPLAADIVRLVGGKANITEAYHCQTRLRFALKDKENFDGSYGAEIKRNFGPAVRRVRADPLLLTAGCPAPSALAAVKQSAAIPFIPGSWQNPVVRTKAPL